MGVLVQELTVLQQSATAIALLVDHRVGMTIDWRIVTNEGKSQQKSLPPSFVVVLCIPT